MNVLEWNVQGAFPPAGSPDRISKQIRFITDHLNHPDLVMLNEVTTNRREMWHDELTNCGYTQIVDTLDWSQTVGQLDIPPFHDFNGVNGNLIGDSRR